ncbi:MAG TPA: hypothetical protein VGM12_15280 [Trebonia sp.]|jgi:hypothetical protein
MNISYTMYQAEHQRSTVEQREADTHAGELAASVAKLGRSLRRTAGGHQSPGHTPEGPAAPTAACFVPRPR